MTNRSTVFRRRTIAAMLAAALIVTGVGANAQRVLSMATLAPAGSTWMRVLDAANRELRRRTNGTVSMRWYPGGVQGDEAEVIRKIRSGRLDGAAVTGAGLAQVHRPVLAFELPAIFENTAQFVRARDALRPALDTAFDAAGFSLLGFDGGGTAHMFSVHEIHTPAQLRGAHPWLWPDNPLMGLIYAEAGVTGVRLQLPEVLAALQTNRIDVVYGNALIAIALQWAPHVHFMSGEGASAMLGGLVVSRAQFSAMTADEQRILREVMNEYHILLARNRARDDENAERVLLSRGMTTVTMAPPERAQWMALFAGVRTRAVGQVADGAWIARVQAAGRGQ